MKNNNLTRVQADIDRVQAAGYSIGKRRDGYYLDKGTPRASTIVFPARDRWSRRKVVAWAEANPNREVAA